MVSREKKSSRLVYYSIFFLLIVFGIAVRCSTHDGFTLNFLGHFNFFDPDSYYYLRRLAHFLQNFPQALHFDPLLSWPSGSKVDWPDGTLWLYGLPLYLLGVENFHGLELGASILSVLYGSLCSIILLIISTRLFPRKYQIIALFIASLSPLLVRYSCLGIVDHHIFEAIIVSLTLWGALKSGEDKSVWASIALGAMWALSFAISSSSVFTVSIGLISLWLAFDRDLSRRNFLLISASFLFSYVLVLLWHQSRWLHSFDMRMPSLFQLAIVFGLLCFISIGVFAPNRRFAWKAQLGFLGVLLAVVVFVPGFRSTLSNAIQYVFFRQGILQHVVEANPIWSRFGEWDFHFGFANLGFLFPVLLLAPLSLVFHKSLSRSEKFLMIFILLMMIPALTQRRFLQLLVPAYILSSTWLLYQLNLFFTRKGLRLRAIVAFGFVALMLLPSVKYGFAPNLENMHRVDFNIAGLFVKEAEINKGEAWARLGGKLESSGGIWAPPNMGHLLTYVSGYGSLMNVFYRKWDLVRDYQIRTADSPANLISALRAQDVKYALITNDFMYFEMLSSVLDKPTDYFIEYQDNKKVFRIDHLEKFTWVDLILHPDKEWVGTKEIFAASIVENYFYNSVRAFEVGK